MCQMGLAGGASNARGENPSEIEVSFLSLAVTSAMDFSSILVGEAVPRWGHGQRSQNRENQCL